MSRGLDSFVERLLMRYRIKVGKEFECFSGKDENHHLVVNIVHPIREDRQTDISTPIKAQSRFSSIHALVAFIVLLLEIAILPPLALGAITGDYSELRNLSKSSAELLRALASFLR